MAQIKRLKRQHLGIEFAEASDLPIGSQGEVITADTLKPYLDQIAQKATPAQIATAVNALETKILGGAGLDADTLAELNSKVVALQNLTDADKTGILNLLALKVNTTDIMPIVNAKADEESVASRLATKADESSVASRLNGKVDTTFLESNYYNENELTTYVGNSTNNKISEYDETVVSRLATKADEASVASRLATKASETSVASRLAEKASIEQLLTVEAIAQSAVTDEILGIALAQKITAAQAETIAQGLTTALENKIMGGVGTDADTMAELKALLDNLQSLSEGDVNGVMQLVSEKIAKSDIYNAVVYPEGIDSNTVGATLASFVTATNVSSEKVVSSSLLNLLLKDLMAGMSQGWQQQGQANDGFSQSIAEKLDKSEFDAVLANESTIGYQLKAKKSIEFPSIAVSNLEAEIINFNRTPFGDDDTPQFIDYCLSEGTGNFIVGNEEDNSRRFGISEFVSVIANSPNSEIAQKIAAKLTKEEFAQLFQLLAQELPYLFTNGTSINAQVTTQKKIAFDNDTAIKKLVVGDMQIDSLAGVSFNESGYPVNTNEVTSSQIGTDLPDEGGDGFLHFVLVDAEEGFVRRVKPMQLMNLLAFNVNSPVKQMFADKDLIISELTARVQALEDLFETQPA